MSVYRPDRRQSRSTQVYRGGRPYRWGSLISLSSGAQPSYLLGNFLLYNSPMGRIVRFLNFPDI